jgi:hypothetical protein
MRWNINSSKFKGEGYTENQIWRAIHQKTGQTARGKKLCKLFEEQGMNTAVNYLSFNLTLRWTKTFKRFFPDALRATVHPKPDQISIPIFGKSNPWNGMAFVEDETKFFEMIKVRDFYEIVQEIGVVENRLYGTDQPFYFQAGN